MDADSAHRARTSLVIVLAAVLPLLACAVLTLSRDTVANTNAALGLVLLVVAAASTGLRTAGIIAALSSAVWFDFFLTEPYYQFTITDRADIENAGLLLLVGAAVTEVALWGRRQQARASQQSGYLAGVLDAAATVSAGQTSTDALIDHVSAQIVDVLEIDECHFVVDTTVAALPTLNADGTVTRQGHTIDVALHGFPANSEIALAIQKEGVTHGHFMLVAATEVFRPSLDQRRVAVALANQVGAALAVRAPGQV